MLTETLYTRADMFHDNAIDGMAAHRKFYGQIVKQCKIVPTDYVLIAATPDKIAEDLHMNNVRNLVWWDRQAYGLSQRRDVAQALRARGDFPSIGASLCLLKEAVRQHYEQGV
jgi:hypothetical protein